MLLTMLVIWSCVAVLLITMIPLWIYLHRVLSRLDDILLREPYFRRSEQINCLVWPFNYWKTGIYFTLIAAPNISRRKRFKGLTDPLPVSRRTVIACRIQFSLLLFGSLLFIVYLIHTLIALYLYGWSG